LLESQGEKETGRIKIAENQEMRKEKQGHASRNSERLVAREPY
jgi:hypothetical protein